MSRFSQNSLFCSPIIILVKDLENLLYLIIVADPVGHHTQELLELNCPVLVLVHLVHHLLELFVRGSLPKLSEHCPQFLKKALHFCTQENILKSYKIKGILIKRLLEDKLSAKIDLLSRQDRGCVEKYLDIKSAKIISIHRFFLF